jgi:hypothetical protein
MKPLRDGIRPCLSLYPTFTELREHLSLLFWEVEAEKMRAPRTSSDKPPTPTSRDTTHPTSSRTNMKEEKDKPAYSDKRKTELSAKGACFNCEETGHMAKDYPKKNPEPETRTMSTRKGSIGCDGPEQIPDPQRGQQVLAFLQNVEDHDG